MNIEKLTKLPPVEAGFIIDEKRPVILFSMDVKDAGCAAPHAHPRGQFIYASSGTMRVICGKNIWVVPCQQAVWVPPYVEHEVFFPGKVTLNNLFIDPSHVKNLPEKCTVTEVSPLLRELILKATSFEQNSGRTERVMAVILDELAGAAETDLRLPLASDPRLMRVMNGLMKAPGCTKGIEFWADTAGASSRTLMRLFQRETGFSFYEWRKRLRLQEAVKRLGEGEDVTGVALDLGYSSLSAFIKMFRETLGTTPGKLSR